MRLRHSIKAIPTGNSAAVGGSGVGVCGGIGMDELFSHTPKDGKLASKKATLVLNAPASHKSPT